MSGQRFTSRLKKNKNNNIKKNKSHKREKKGKNVTRKYNNLKKIFIIVQCIYKYRDM